MSATPAGSDYPFEESNQAFVQDQGRFKDVSAEIGSNIAALRSSRGAAFGDIDNDGDVDVLVNNGNSRPHLFVSEFGYKGQWLDGVVAPFSGQAQVLQCGNSPPDPSSSRSVP